MKIVFACKDELIARYCQQTFGEQWSNDLAGCSEEDRSVLLGQWTARLFTEATRQEWWDYTVEGDPQRRVLTRGPDGNPLPLLPIVMTVP